MALTFSNVRYGVTNNNRWYEADVAFDSSYPTGGYVVTLPHPTIGLKVAGRIHPVFEVYPDGATSTWNTHGRQIVPTLTNPAAPTLKVYTANNTEAANTSDQSQIIVRLRFLGQ